MEIILIAQGNFEESIGDEALKDYSILFNFIQVKLVIRISTMRTMISVEQQEGQ
jgi:hypothetical protein